MTKTLLARQDLGSPYSLRDGTMNLDLKNPMKVRLRMFESSVERLVKLVGLMKKNIANLGSRIIFFEPAFSGDAPTAENRFSGNRNVFAVAPVFFRLSASTRSWAPPRCCRNGGRC